MKKILAALLVLALVAPAMAVNFTLTPGAANSGKLTVAYDIGATEVVRGMALKVTVLSGNAKIDGTGDVVLQNITPKFNTFVDWAYSNQSGYAVGMGHPIAKATAAGAIPDTGGVIADSNSFSVSMGYLDQGGNQAGLTVDSFFDIFFTLTTDSVVKVEVDTLRGGIVGDNLVASNLPLQASLTAVVNYNLTTATTTGGTVSDPGIGTFSKAGTVPLVATANANWYFWKWTGDTGTIANVNAASTTINMNAAKSVTANFTYACQQFNFTKLRGGTDTAVNVTDLNALINWVNANKTGTSFGVSSSNPAWNLPAGNPDGPIFNITKKMGGTDSAVNVTDLNALIDFVNKRKTGTSFGVNCSTCNCG